MGNRIRVVCQSCGGIDVRCVAHTKWNVNTQSWELDDLFDEYYCQDCQEEVFIEETIIIGSHLH